MKENKNAAYNKLNQLESIGNKLADFEEIPNSKNGEPFSILGKGNYGYVEKMKSKIDNKIYAIKLILITLGILLLVFAMLENKDGEISFVYSNF